jgi:hypothetical protein
MIHTFARISASRVAKHSTRLPTDLNLRVSRVSSPLTLSSTRSIVSEFGDSGPVAPTNIGSNDVPLAYS